MPGFLSWKRVLFKFLGLSVLAFLTGGLAMLVYTRDLETLGLGLLAPLFVLPALLVFLLAGEVLKLPKFVSHLAYWHCFLPLPLWLLATAFFPSEGARSDGADDFALAMFVPLVASGFMVYGHALSGKWARRF